MIIKRYEPGTKMRVQKKIYSTNEGEQKKKKEMVTVQVIKQYQHHILVATREGIRWCITNGELYQIACQQQGKGKQ